MLLSEYIDAVRLRRPGANAAQIERDVSTALQQISDRVALSPPPKRSLLRRTFTNVSVNSSGEATLPTGMNVTGVGTAEISPDPTWPTTEIVQWLENPADLRTPPDIPDMAFFSYENDKLLFRDYTGTALTGTIPQIIASFEAAIADIVDSELKEELIDIGASLAVPAA